MLLWWQPHSEIAMADKIERPSQDAKIGRTGERVERLAKQLAGQRAAIEIVSRDERNFNTEPLHPRHTAESNAARLTCGHHDVGENDGLEGTMASRQLAALVLSDGERKELTSLAARRNTAQALALRARIVLGCADGTQNKDVAERLQVDRGNSGQMAAPFRRTSHRWVTG
jgi:hypothetical protein